MELSRRRRGRTNWMRSHSKRALKELKSSGFLFFYFYNILHFDEFCRTHYFEFLNSVLHKNLEVYSSFFRIFYFKFLKISNLTNRFKKNSFTDFHKNPPAFELFLMHDDKTLFTPPPSEPCCALPCQGRIQHGCPVFLGIWCSSRTCSLWWILGM
jgi:hypothetical protein